MHEQIGMESSDQPFKIDVLTPQGIVIVVVVALILKTLFGGKGGGGGGPVSPA